MASSVTEEHPNAAYIEPIQHPEHPQLPDEEAHPLSASSVSIITPDEDGQFSPSAIETLYDSRLIHSEYLKNLSRNQMPAYLKHLGVTLKGAARVYSDEFDGAMVVNMINDPLMSPEMWEYLKDEIGITGLKQRAKLLTDCKRSDPSESDPSHHQRAPAASPNPTVVVNPEIIVKTEDIRGPRPSSNPRFIAMQKGAASWPTLPKPAEQKMYPEIAKLRAYRTQLQTFTHAASQEFSDAAFKALSSEAFDVDAYISTLTQQSIEIDELYCNAIMEQKDLTMVNNLILNAANHTCNGHPSGLKLVYQISQRVLRTTPQSSSDLLSGALSDDNIAMHPRELSVKYWDLMNTFADIECTEEESVENSKIKYLALNRLLQHLKHEMHT